MEGGLEEGVKETTSSVFLLPFKHKGNGDVHDNRLLTCLNVECPDFPSQPPSNSAPPPFIQRLMEQKALRPIQRTSLRSPSLSPHSKE